MRFILAACSLVLVTLPGLAFFAIPLIIVLVRAAIWGTLLNQLPTQLFLLALPVFILEGEGYVIASVAGINLGLSWLKPCWIHRGEKPSRLETLKMALKECVHLYVFVIILLLAAAIIEAVIITTQL